MNSKKIIWSIITAWILASCGTPNNKNQQTKDIHTDSTHQQVTKKELTNILFRNKEIPEIIRPDVITLDIDTIKKSKDIEDMALLNHIKKHYKSLWIMLWWTDAKIIMQKYNQHIKNGINENINNVDTLYVPRISPSLVGFFDNRLEDFLSKHDTINNLAWDNKHVIITTKNNVGMFSTWVYINWSLAYAYAASPWKTWYQKDRKNWNYHAFTPLWSYIITRIKADKKSDKNDYMAFYLWFYDPRWIWLHASQLVNGKINDTLFMQNWQSHGCIRWVHIYRYLTYKEIKPLFDKRKAWDGAPIAVVNYRPTSEQEKKGATRYLENKIPLDYSRENSEYTKPILSAQHIWETGKIDTVDFSHFAYLYWFKKEIIDSLKMNKIK